MLFFGLIPLPQLHEFVLGLSAALHNLDGCGMVAALQRITHCNVLINPFNFASALEVEIRDLFELVHLQAGGVKAEEIEKLLEGADEEKKRTIMKIIRAVVR